MQDCVCKCRLAKYGIVVYILLQSLRNGTITYTVFRTPEPITFVYKRCPVVQHLEHL